MFLFGAALRHLPECEVLAGRPAAVEYLRGWHNMPDRLCRVVFVPVPASACVAGRALQAGSAPVAFEMLPFLYWGRLRGAHKGACQGLSPKHILWIFNCRAVTRAARGMPRELFRFALRSAVSEAGLGTGQRDSKNTLGRFVP